MKHIVYNTIGTCSRQIEFDLTDDLKLKNISFFGGCNGNLKAISILCDGKDALSVANLLKGNECGMKNTSCADQLAIAIKRALNDK